MPLRKMRNNILAKRFCIIGKALNNKGSISYSSVHVNESKLIWGKRFVDFFGEVFELQTNPIPIFAFSFHELSHQHVRFLL